MTKSLIWAAIRMTKSLIWVAIRVAAVYCLARYACDFSDPQAVFLTVLATLSIERFLAAKRFQPFSLWIKPNYATILMDAGFLAEEGEWQELLKAQGEEAETKDLTDGVMCFVLSYNVDSGTHVIAWPKWKTYTSRLELSFAPIELESLPSAAALPAVCREGYGRLTARFGIKPGWMGLRIFMRINDRVWKERWAGATGTKPPFDESEVDPYYGTVDLTIAVIPECFYEWKTTWGSVSLKQRRSTLAALGWKTDYEPEFPMQAYGISHRYVTVTHEPIDQDV